MAPSRSIRVVDFSADSSFGGTNGQRGTPGAWSYVMSVTRAATIRANVTAAERWREAGSDELATVRKDAEDVYRTLERDVYRRHYHGWYSAERDSPETYALYQRFSREVQAETPWERAGRVLEENDYGECCCRFLGDADHARAFLALELGSVARDVQSLIALARQWASDARVHYAALREKDAAWSREYEARQMDVYRQRAEEVRYALREHLPAPRFDLAPLVKHGLIRQEEADACEVKREREYCEYWWGLAQSGELPEGVIPFTPEWEAWRDSSAYQDWVWGDGLTRSTQEDDQLEALEERMTSAHSKRLRLRRKILGRHCRSSSRAHRRT